MYYQELVKVIGLSLASQNEDNKKKHKDEIDKLTNNPFSRL